MITFSRCFTPWSLSEEELFKDYDYEKVEQLREMIRLHNEWLEVKRASRFGYASEEKVRPQKSFQEINYEYLLKKMEFSKITSSASSILSQTVYDKIPVIPKEKWRKKVSADSDDILKDTNFNTWYYLFPWKEAIIRLEGSDVVLIACHKVRDWQRILVLYHKKDDIDLSLKFFTSDLCGRLEAGEIPLSFPHALNTMVLVHARIVHGFLCSGLGTTTLGF